MLAGVVGSMAMTGVRELATALEWVEETPPEAIAKEAAPGLMLRLPENHEKAVVEIMHWAYGGFGGAVFGLLPRSWRKHIWTGPAYGLLMWTFFQSVIAPALGLAHAERSRSTERAVLIADHLLYGFILAEPGRRLALSSGDER